MLIDHSFFFLSDPYLILIMEEQIEQAVAFALSPTADQSLKSQVGRQSNLKEFPLVQWV